MTDSRDEAAGREQRAAARRLARRAMTILDYDPIWTGSLAQVAVEAAVVHGVESLLRSGHTDPFLIIERILCNVCGGNALPRLSSVIDFARLGEFEGAQMPIGESTPN